MVGIITFVLDSSTIIRYILLLMMGHGNGHQVAIAFSCGWM